MNDVELPRSLQAGSPTLFKRMINLSLRRWRDEAGLKQGEAATRLRRTTAHISNIETDRLPPAPDLELLLDFYGKGDRIPFMMEMLEAARKANWWKALSGKVPAWFDLFLGLEEGAIELASFDSVVVRGLFQTRDYAEAVIRGNPDLTDEQVQALVDIRMQRQHILDRRANPVHVSTVMDESVLYRQRGSSDTMRAQLQHLLDLSQRPRIDIQILPFSAGSTPAQDGSTFTMMKFPPGMDEDLGVVFVELLTGGKYFEKASEIVEYRRALTRLHSMAADPKATRAIIRKAMKEVKP
ncbi:helix-turn-helix transcriptional regulator [Actinokineospora sp. NBRC 105648]|uniref:helix-turn-helix domain-containing protein n=1 Tax=Actinokineospora sp. NBRC 105648 TaxID=3032206 RepID=UPI0024A129B0|nr:helix-turn-helix transcriptional regulator [Actinokineospora sp. NBRC 105648]GLZ39517.1 transcriptional regulator [Actinokineospora sp. NBRC 105648]